MFVKKRTGRGLCICVHVLFEVCNLPQWFHVIFQFALLFQSLVHLHKYMWLLWPLVTSFDFFDHLVVCVTSFLFDFSSFLVRPHLLFFSCLTPLFFSCLTSSPSFSFFFWPPSFFLTSILPLYIPLFFVHSSCVVAKRTWVMLKWILWRNRAVSYDSHHRQWRSANAWRGNCVCQRIGYILDNESRPEHASSIIVRSALRWKRVFLWMDQWSKTTSQERRNSDYLWHRELRSSCGS